MDTCMLPGERAPVKRSKSWRREHLETHTRHTRYISVQTISEAETDDVFSPYKKQPTCDSHIKGNVLYNFNSGNNNCISLYKNGEVGKGIEISPLIEHNQKVSYGGTNFHVPHSVRVSHSGESATSVKFTLLKRTPYENKSVEVPKMERDFPGNKKVSSSETNNAVSDIHRNQDVLSTVKTNNPNEMPNASVLVSNKRDNVHFSIPGDLGCGGFVSVTDKSNSKPKDVGNVSTNEQLLFKNTPSEDIITLELGCCLSGLGILDTTLEAKVHSDTLVFNDKHNCNYRISSNCGNASNCNCIHQYLLSNGLIGYCITKDFQFQIITLQYNKIIGGENETISIHEDDYEDVMIFFGQTKQKLVIKAKLRNMINPPVLQRPDERHFTTLDSSLKRNTAFVRKLRIFTGSQLNKLLEDMVTLNLTKYLSEIASAIVECKLKMSDVWAAVQICYAFHQMYADFSNYLLENWHKVLMIKKDEPIPNAAKLRVDLRFYAELITVGIFTPQEGLPLLGNALTMLTYWDKDHYNIKIILSFCRHCGLEYAGLISQKVRLLAGKYHFTVPHSSFLSETKMQSVRSLIKDYYDSLNKHLIREYLALKDFIKQNTRILQTKGELSIKRKEKMDVLQTSLKRLLDGTVQLADILDEEPPQLPSDAISENEGLSTNEVNDLDITEKESLWDDDETKLFYESLPEMKDLVPSKQISPPEEDIERKNQEEEDEEEVEVEEEEDCFDDYMGDDSGDGEQMCREVAEMEDDDDFDIEDEDEEDEDDEVEEEEELEEIEHQSNINSKILMETFINSLPNCTSRDSIDKAAVDFVRNLNTKPNRKKIIKTLYTVPRTRTDLLPYYARFVAAVNSVVPEIANELGKALKQEFRSHVHKKDQLNIESKIKVVRFIAELVKFRMYSKSEAIHCLKILVHDFSHHHIDMCCSLLEGCGKFLSRHNDSHFRLHHYLDQIMRKKTVIPLNARYITMIENAYYQVNPPEIEPKTRKNRPVEHEFIRNLVYHELTRSNIDDILNLILKVNWEDPETASYSVRCLTRAYKVKYFNISCLASLTSGIALQQELEGIQVVDAVLEDIQLGMELNLQEHCQRRLAMIKYLGELYNYRMVENTNIFKALYSLITFGVTWSNDQYSPLDPPESVFRIRLVCTLLNTCGEYFSTGSSKRKLDEYLTFFQYYFWFKYSQPCWKPENLFPYDIKYMFQDIVKRLRPKVQLFTTLDESRNATRKICKEYEKLDFCHSESGAIKSINTEDPEDKSMECILEDEILSDTEASISTEDFISKNCKIVEAAEKSEEHLSGIKTDYCCRLSNTSCLSSTHVENCENFCDVLRPKSPEDQEFLSAFDRMISENMQDRIHETIKPQRLDISVPLYIGSISKKSNEKNKIEENPESVVNFVLILRKGHKALYKNVAVPVNSEMALNLKYHEEAERAEKEYVKRLTLDINERLEEEDYQEMFNKIQKSSTGNLNRDRKHRCYNSKEVPNVDVIFNPNRKLR